MVQPALVHHLAIGALHAAVAAAVQPAARRTERIGQETRGGQRRLPPVTTGQARPAQVQLARHRHPGQPSLRVQHIDLAVHQRLPDRQHTRCFLRQHGMGA
ncbi:hypothetical protein ACIGHF_00005, partial [Stenotrophomonas sp. NPDC077464]|uniref:hypothetical protein n=1 Tax=Stenotrophomonas sp. NPDC077464 TaxID=3364533 RepID=UPI0037D564CA